MGGRAPRDFPAGRPAALVLRALLVASLSATATVQAQPAPTPTGPSAKPEGPAEKPTADALFEEARRLMLAGEHVEACPKLEESQRLDPAVGTLLHLGECFAKTGRTASAWRAFRQAVAAARTEGRLDREQIALARAQNLEPELARLQVSVPQGHDLPGLVVRTDGNELPRASWGAAIPVDTGPHVLEVTAPGYRPWRTQAAVMQLGGTVVVSVPVLISEDAPEEGGGPVPVGPASVAIDPRARAANERDRMVGIGSLAGGGVFAAVGAGFGVAAIRAWSDARAACVDRVCTDEGVRDASSARTSARISTALFAVGAVGAATGVYFLLRRPTPTRSALWVAPGLGGASLGGGFD